MQHDFTKEINLKNAELKKVTSGKKTIWRQEVNEPRLIQASIMHFNPIEFRHDMYETLLDREYSWIRVGERGSQRPSYMLEPESESSLPEDLQELRDSLPDLEDVALNKVKTLDEEAPKEYETVDTDAEDPFATSESASDDPGF